MPLSWQVLLIGLLLLASAFFSSSETALFSVNRLRLKQRQAKNPLDSWFVGKLLENPRRLLQVILFGNEVINTATSVLIASLCFELFHSRLPTVVLIFLPALISLPVIVCLGEILPKAVAIKLPDIVARFNAPLLTLFAWLVRPLQNVINPLVTWFIRTVLRAPQEIRLEQGAALDEETFRHMVDISHSEGAVHDSERNLIHRVLELDDLLVMHLMTKKEKVLAVELSTPIPEVVQRIQSQRFSRIPVYQNSLERISGVLYAKDLLRLMRQQPTDLKGLLRPAYFVPQSRKVSELLRDFQEQHIHIALVVDEFGHFVGLITLQDILDRLFDTAGGR